MFGTKKEDSKSTVDINTGRNIDDIVKGLINAICDPSKEVQTTIHKSLSQIGHEEPLLVLSKGLNFLNSTSKSNKQHRVLVMNVMSEIVDENDFEMSNEFAEALVYCAAAEIVAEKTINSEWQNAACTLLIALARIVPDVVAKELLERFPANTPPHYFVVKALGDFSFRYPNLFVPHLKEIISRTLPLLAMIKHDNLRWVFSAGLGRWSEAAIKAYRDKTNKNKIPLSEFAGSMTTATKHCLNEWLGSSQAKIRLATCEAIGYMAHLMDAEQLVSLLPRIIQGLVGLLKREARSGEQVSVSTGLCNVIEATLRQQPEALQEHLELLLTNIHTYICTTAGVDDEREKKNHRYLLRSMALLGKRYTDQVVTFLQKNIDPTNSAKTIGTLAALQYIVEKLDDELQTFKEIIVSSVKILVQFKEKKLDLKLQLFLAQLINTMGEYDYLSRPGGKDLLMFIITGSAITDEEVDQFMKKYAKKSGELPPGIISPGEIREESDKILYNFSEPEMSELMDEIFWPFGFESMTPKELAPAFAILCKCMADVAKRKKNDDDYFVDFDDTVNVNLPRPEAIFARLIVMLNVPYGRNNPGVNILKALYCVSPLIHSNLVDNFKEKLPQMKKYIDDKENYSQDQWENYVLNLLRSCIDAVDDDEWTVKIGDAILQQIPLYEGERIYKKTLLSMAGLIIQKAHLKEFVYRAINDLFHGVDHNSDDERLGASRGLGQAAARHTDPVLTKLSKVMTTAPKKAGWFSKITKEDVTVESQATAMLAYGYVCMLTPLDLLVSRVEVHVVNNLLPVFRKTPGQMIKENGLRAIDLIGKAVHPKRVPDFILKPRDDLIAAIIETISPKKIDSGTDIHRLRVLGLEALSTLLKLPPIIKADTFQSIISATLPFYTVKVPDETTDELVMDNLNIMLATILQADPTEGTLNDLLLAIEPYTKSSVTMERERACTSYIYLLKEYAVKISESKPTSKSFLNCGRIIGELLPRVTESSITVRRLALNGIYVTLRIHYFMKLGASSELPESVQKLGPLREKIEAREPNELFELSKELAGVLIESIDPEHLNILLETILNNLGDVEIDGANGICVIFNGLIRARGKEIEQQTTLYVSKMIECMEKYAAREQVVNGLLHACRGLARHHLSIVVNSLLKEKLPHQKEVVKALQTVATDSKLTARVLEQLIDIINNSQQYEEKKATRDSEPVLSPTHDPSSATAALAEICEMTQISKFAKEFYPKLAMTLMIRCGSALGCHNNPPIEDVKNALKKFLDVVEDNDIVEELNKAEMFDKFAKKEDYPEAIKFIVKLMCEKHSDLIRPMFQFVNGFASRPHEDIRVAGTCCVAVILNYIRNDREVVHASINALLSRSGTDEKPSVKFHALQGLANITKHPKDMMHKYITPVVGALIANLEDANEDLILEAMNSCKEVFSIADDEFVAPLLLNLCVRLKPSFEKKNPKLRASSIDLFGTLHRYCHGSLSESLINNVHQNLPTILLHLVDPDENVVKSCKKSLRLLIPVLGSKELPKLFEGEEFEPENTLDFDAFAEKFAALWITEFRSRIGEMVMSLVLFFKSEWDTICAFASLIVGYILAKIDDEQRQRVNLRHACTEMVFLLKSQSQLIREKTAKVLGLLHKL